MIEITAKKTYGKRTVLNINGLVLEEGLVYAVIGSNGSGKTTLIQAIAGLIPYEGKISLGTAKKSDIGYMPQKSYAFDMSVMTNMTVAQSFAARRRKRGRALALLRQLGILHLKRKNAARLSGGETQRLALARLLVDEHKILLLDEPVASMDINSAELAEKALNDYRELCSPTVIAATHSLQQAKRIADKIIFMSEGEVDAFGDAETLLENPPTEKLRNFLHYGA